MIAGTNKTLENANGSQLKMSARTLWGKVIIYLREHHAVALHIACGDITDVEVKDNKFIINTTDAYMFELLNGEENKKDLTSALNNFGIKNFEIIKKEKVLTKTQEDIIKLKSIFEDKLIIE
ncbi:MAG: hypothetical protein IJW25_00630 [Clostridia bacterium]|nr:hypothetical protein [Clostridia bacterium]